MGSWLLGYNSFYDKALDDRMARGSVGAEAWGESLRLSANHYQPLGGWQQGSSLTQQQRMASGYDVTAQARLPFYQHINTSVSVEHILAIASICSIRVPATITRSRCRWG